MELELDLDLTAFDFLGEGDGLRESSLWFLPFFFGLFLAPPFPDFFLAGVSEQLGEAPSLRIELEGLFSGR